MALKDSPDAFGAIHGEEAARSLEEHTRRLATSLVYGAYAGHRIVGVVGLKREIGPKESHKGYIWGLYVVAEKRAKGIGAALVAAALEAAPTLVEQVRLTVVAHNAQAIGLYERLGFLRYGLEPRALKDADGYADELLMVKFTSGSHP
ncbi:GNAT family N-acetyltransferase [Alsobacter sp. SYSU BS001988]